MAGGYPCFGLLNALIHVILQLETRTRENPLSRKDLTFNRPDAGIDIGLICTSRYQFVRPLICHHGYQAYVDFV